MTESLPQGVVLFLLQRLGIISFTNVEKMQFYDVILSGFCYGPDSVFLIRLSWVGVIPKYAAIKCWGIRCS